MMTTHQQFEGIREHWLQASAFPSTHDNNEGVCSTPEEWTTFLRWMMKYHPEEEELIDAVSGSIARCCGSLASSKSSQTKHCDGKIVLQETGFGDGETLGFQTWPSAQLFTEHFAGGSLQELLRRHHCYPSDHPLACLELGCGTGLAGIYCSTLNGLFGSVVLSDACPTVAKLVAQNLALNACPLDVVSFVPYDWRSIQMHGKDRDEQETPSEKGPWSPHSFDVIIACDAIYDVASVQCLPHVVDRYLTLHKGIFISIIPMRKQFQREIDSFHAEMRVVMDDSALSLVSCSDVSISSGLDHRICIYSRRAID